MREKEASPRIPAIVQLSEFGLLVSVGFSISCVEVLGPAWSYDCNRCMNTGYFRCPTFSCATLQIGLVRIMSPLL